MRVKETYRPFTSALVLYIAVSFPASVVGMALQESTPKERENTAAAVSAVVTPETLLRHSQPFTSRVSNVRWLSDSRRITFLFQTNNQPGAVGTQAIILDTLSGKAARLSVPGTTASISPDGAKIAYVTSEKD